MGEEAGLAALGFARAAPLEEARSALESRKAAGLHAGMQFTYRNPARSTDPSRTLPGAASLVVGAWSYGPGAPAEPVGAGARVAAHSLGGASPRPRGRVARYAQEDYYRRLRAALDQVAARLVAYGWQARVLADDNALVDRAAAQRAGLGWYGKNANILLAGLGSWFVLGSVLTDAVLPYSEQAKPACGACRRCLRSCPTGALVAPGVLDARRCLAWLVQAEGIFPWEHRVALGDRIYGCDDCQEVCPPNLSVARAEAKSGRPPDEAGPAVDGGALGPGVDLLDLLTAPDDELIGRFGRWYIPRRDPRYLRRNALVALGNSGLGSVVAVQECLRHYLAHADAMLRAHATWAALRLGRGDLLEEVGAQADPSPLVQAELARRDEVVVVASGEGPGHAAPAAHQ